MQANKITKMVGPLRDEKNKFINMSMFMEKTTEKGKTLHVHKYTISGTIESSELKP